MLAQTQGQTHPFSVHDHAGHGPDQRPAGLAGRRGRSCLWSARPTWRPTAAGPISGWSYGRHGPPPTDVATRRTTAIPGGRRTARRSGSSPAGRARRRSGGLHPTAARPGRSRTCPWMWATWSPALTAATSPSPWRCFLTATRSSRPRPGLADLAKRKASGRIYDRLFVRHWDTWSDGRRSHVFVIPADGGEPVDVMKGMDADCPSKPFGGPEEITFTPDGKGVVFTARDAGRAEPWSTDFDLYLAPVDGSKPLQVPDRGQSSLGHVSRSSLQMARPWPTWPWPGRAMRRIGFASCCGPGRTALSGC